jgi:hypothetical protein
MCFIIVIKQLQVTTATNYRLLTCYMNVTYVVGYESVWALLLHWVLCVLWVLIICLWGYVKVTILHKEEGLQWIICVYYSWEVALNISFDASLIQYIAGKLNSMKDYTTNKCIWGAFSKVITQVQGSIYNFRDWCCHLYSSCSSVMQWMIVLAYLGSQCTKFHASGSTCWFCTSFYLESCIWPDVILQ